MSPATAPSTPPCLARVRGLHHRFGNEPVLNGLDFELHPGRVAAFLGRNGAGKSTALSILAGILVPTAGEVEVAGATPWAAPGARRTIGFLPERPPLYPQLGCEEHLQFCIRLHGMGRAEGREAVESALEGFDLAGERRRPVGRLSKGFQQRLGLAMATVHRPQLLLLDEPGSGLDPVQLRRLRELIGSLGDDVAVLYSTHMLNEALAVADDLLVLCQGRLSFSGPPSALGTGAEARVLALMSGSEAGA